MPTETFASPVQLSLAYSPNKLINPQIDAATIQTLNTFQTMPCNQNKSITRYFALHYTKKKLGIDYFNCPEFSQPNPGGGFADNATALYGGQLPPATGPSMYFRVLRNSATPNNDPIWNACRLELTYYIKYRGVKGINAIDNP